MGTDMSLNKSISHGKEKRKPYYGAKAFDETCRNHGSDDWAKNNRQFQKKKEELRMRSRIKDFEEEY